MITNHEIYEHAIEKIESGVHNHICGALHASCGCGSYSFLLRVREFVREEFLLWFLPENESPTYPFFGSLLDPENREARILALHFLIQITKRKTFK